MKSRAQSAISKLGVELDPDMSVSEMPSATSSSRRSPGRSTGRNPHPRADEPTAVLTETEAEILLASLKTLASEGIAIIFISHRLHEVVEIADRIVVLRDGTTIKDVPAKGATVRDIASWMVGRAVSTERVTAGEIRVFGDEILSVQNLWVDMPGETVQDVNFSVRKGEIFGIGGLAGQGKLGIPNGIMGFFPAGGEVTFHGKPVVLNDPRAALERGMAFVSEDRRGVGLLLDESLDWNIAFTANADPRPVPQAHPGRPFQDPGRSGHAGAHRRVREDARHQVHESVKQKAKELSGGNQQKVCLAKAFT
jgi:simple sugar transport system ATP-binding protein